MDNENCIPNVILLRCKEKNEITKFSGKWVNPEKIIVCEVTHTEKDGCHVFLIYRSHLQVLRYEYTTQEQQQHSGKYKRTVGRFLEMQ